MKRNVCLLFFALSVLASAFAQQKGYSLPDKKGQLRITPDWLGDADISLVNDDTQLRASWQSESLGIYMTAFVQSAEEPGDGKVCRDTWWPQTETGIEKLAKIKNKRLYENGDIAMVEYIVPEVQGREINQKNIHAYVAGGDIWAEIHISKINFKPHDQAVLDKIINSISILPDYVNNSRDYWRWGAIASNHEEYARAALYFQRSLDMEKSVPVLDPKIFRKMVAQLGYFYQKFGALDKAQSTLEYAISRNPDYALNHYNLASVFAEKGELDRTLEELRLAYKYKNNITADDAPFVDPLTDEYFAVFAGSEKFVTAVRQMQQEHP